MASLAFRGLNLGIEFRGGADFAIPNATCSVSEAREVAEAARSSLPAEILAKSGRALYSPASTLVSDSPIYFLGIHPGETPGDTQEHNVITIGEAGGLALVVAGSREHVTSSAHMNKLRRL